MKKISIFYSGWGEHWPLAELADDGRNLLFEYSPEALKQGLELSPLNLPLRSQAFADFPTFQNRLPGLIADSLPDGWGLLVMDRFFKSQGLSLSQISPLDRLAFIGNRAMGALTYSPPMKINEDKSELNLRELAKEVQKIISEEPSKALQKIAEIGGSPHGARPKALVQYSIKEKLISTDQKSIGDSWLVKFPAAHEHKEVCAIENYYADLAKQCGIEMTKTEYFDLGKNLAAFGTERFDRKNKIKIPQHTAAGALNANFRIPSVDYISLLRLTRLMSKDQREVEKAYLQCVFNVIFHNRDDHPKNFSFLMDQQKNWKLSPAYDLTFSSGPGGEHQTDICGEAKNPGREQLLELAKKTGIEKKRAEKTIEIVRAVAEEFLSWKNYADIRKDTWSDIRSAIRNNLNRF